MDDAAFRAELENLDGSLRAGAGETRRLPNPIDLLGKAFPFASNEAAPQPAPAARTSPAFSETAADVDRRESRTHAQSRTRHLSVRRNGPPRLAIAIVIVLGFAAGAAAATMVFHDRAVQLVAAWTSPHP